MEIFSAEELASELTKLGCESCRSYDLTSFVFQRINKLSEEVCNSIPSNRNAYQGQTGENFIDAVKAICKERGIEVRCRKEDNYYDLCIYSDILYIMHVYNDKVESIGWHPLFLKYHDVNVLAHMVAAEDGELMKLHILRERLSDSIRHYYWNVQNKMYDEKSLQAALSDESAYDKIQSEYTRMYNEILPLEKFEHKYTWEEALRERGIKPALRMLDDIDRYVKGKSPKSADKYKKRFCNAQNVLEGARKRGLLTDEEAKKIIGWNEYINPIVSDYSVEAIVNEYLNSVEKAYQDTLVVCDERGTQYMAKKKQKLLSDMEVCRLVKEDLAVNCFIDKSTHSQSVYHFNVILNGNNVLVFRIPKITPDLYQIELMVRLSLIIENISKVLDKTIRLTSNSGSRDGKKLAISAPKELNETAMDLSTKLKMVKGGKLAVTNTYVTLHLPVCGLEWCIAMKRKEASGLIDSITELLTDYMEIYKELECKDVKGIYPNRMPNI